MGAEKGNKYAEGNEGGRPSLYKPELYPEQVYKLCLLGATDADIASFFNVDERTVNNWKTEHDEFFQSINEGKKLADMEVANSLYKTTQDRQVPKEIPFKLKNVYWNDEGKRVEEEKVEVIEVMETIPADFRAQSLWLRNRSPKNWRDKQEVDHTTGGDKLNTIFLGQGIKPDADE